jgi:hypothetical protein
MLMNKVLCGMALGVALMTIACAPLASENQLAAPPEAGAGPCDAANAGSLVGELVSQALAGEAMRLSGAQEFRWIPPNGMITMDYRRTRLNIEYNESRRAVAIRCG